MYIQLSIDYHYYLPLKTKINISNMFITCKWDIKGQIVNVSLLFTACPVV